MTAGHRDVEDWVAGVASEVGYRAVEWASDQWWDAQGGPWCAIYRRSEIATSIGIGEGEPHRVHFMDPADALEYFRSLPKRYQRNETLRGTCLIVYKDNWYCVEPYADDADHAVDVMRAEVARDERREHASTSPGYADGSGSASA
jgi:hypothetical protein